jgi:hypothetical protein
MLSRASIGYLSNGEADERSELYNAMLDCKQDGAWAWITADSISR